MRIRKEISPWNGKMFIRITLIVFVIYNGLMLLAKTLDGDALFSLSYPGYSIASFSRWCLPPFSPMHPER